MAVSSAVTSNSASATTAANTVASKATLTSNFNTFLQLLTTQLKNQNPLDPLDTNQFTQQLVQFAQVEQQINMNQQMTTLISMQKAVQTSAALGFVGTTVAVDGSTAKLQNGQAAWTVNPATSGTASIAIKDASGQTVFTDSRTISPGAQNYVWNGRDASGRQLPDGAYTLAITAKDTKGLSVGISTEVQGVVDGVDLTQDPPVLTIGSQSFALDKVKRVVR